jgi:hypothetical protein
MKELELHNNIGVNSAAKVEMNVKKQQEIEYVLEGTIKPQKGHFVWELNEETGAINKAQYKQDTVAYNPMAEKPTERLIINPDCIYIPALNKANAKAKYLKNKEQAHYYSKPPLLNINDITF